MSISLKTQLASFENGIILDSDGNQNTCYNFYDWFCKESSLEKKSIKLFKSVKTFVKKFNIDVENTYVFFKNNCPMNGPLYDDFRICDRVSGDVIFTVTPKSGHNGQAEVYGSSNSFHEPLFEAPNLTVLYALKRKAELEA